MAAVIDKVKSAVGGGNEQERRELYERGIERDRELDSEYNRSHDFGYSGGYGNNTRYGNTGYGREYNSYGNHNLHGSHHRHQGRDYDRDYNRNYNRSYDGDRTYTTGYSTGRSYDRDYDRSYDRDYGYSSGLGAVSSRRDPYRSEYTTTSTSSSLTPYGSNSTSLAGFNPSVDLSETTDAWHVHAELPGIDKSNVHVTCENGRLTISGERARGATTEAGRTYHKTERSYGSFSRTLTLPTNVENKDIKANFLNGILEVTIPKPGHYVERQAARRINII